MLARSKQQHKQTARERQAHISTTLTVWLTPHIKTLRMGSLARNNFTFCPIKCFFFVLVLLALTGAALVQLDDMSQAGNLGYARRQSLSLRASAHTHTRTHKRKPGSYGRPKKTTSASCSSSNSQRVSEKDNCLVGSQR